MTWHGGRVLEHARFHNIYWGSYWNLHQDDRQWFDEWTQQVAPSKELASQCEEYSVNGQRIGAATVVSSQIVTDDNPPATITTDDLSALIDREMQAGNLARPTSEDDVYTVILHPEIKITGEDNAVGYHRRNGYGVHEIMVHFDPYALDVATRNVASVTYSHEMAETITDPDLDAWFDSATGDEIGDVCEGHVASVGTNSIQQEWSMAEGKCVAARQVNLPPDNNGVCPAGMHIENGDCTGNMLSWGCSTGAAGAPSLLALLAGLIAIRLKQRKGVAGQVS
jgi:hypothetical protein